MGKTVTKGCVSAPGRAAFITATPAAETEIERARRKISEIDLESYEVGGSIRDELIGKEPSDLDIAVCGADPGELIDELSRHGSVSPLVVAGQTIGARLYANWTGPEGVEFALSRREASTGEGHTDFDVICDGSVSIETDLARRDYTVNAIARKVGTGELIDPFGGAKDIEEKILRQTTPTTIQEDPLRILRGIVRCSRDGLRIDRETVEAMASEKEKLRPGGPLSAERIFKETRKIVIGDHAADAFRIARDIGVFQEAYPELSPMIGFDQESKYHDMTVDEHTFTVLERAAEFDAPEAVRWAALLHDSGKPKAAFRGKSGRLHFYKNPDDPDAESHEEAGAKVARGFLERMKAPVALQDRVELLVKEHMFPEPRNMKERSRKRNEIKARRLIQRVGRDNIEDLLLLRRCDHTGKNRTTLGPGWEKPFREFEDLVFSQMNAPLKVKELAVSGHDLISLGLKGAKIGETQRELLSRVVADPEMNRRDQLMKWAETLA